MNRSSAKRLLLAGDGVLRVVAIDAEAAETNPAAVVAISALIFVRLPVNLINSQFSFDRNGLN